MNLAVVTVAEVIGAARRNRAPIAAEIAGYLALAAADSLADRLRIVDERSSGLSEEGAVIVAEGPSAGGVDAERSVRALLAKLLEVSSGTAPALVAAGRRPASAGIAAVVSEIEAALIPVNRSAARRALARLARETLRAREDGEPLLEQAVEPPAAPVSPPPPPLAEPVHALPPEPPPVREDTEPLTFVPPTDDDEAETRVRAEVAPVAPPAPPPEPTPLPIEVEVDVVLEPTPAPAHVAPIAAPPEPEPEPAPEPEPEPEPEPGPALPAVSAQPSPRPTPSRPAPAAPVDTGRADELLASFTTTAARSDRDVARDLKRIAGLDPTPAPPPVAPAKDETRRPAAVAPRAGVVDAAPAPDAPLDAPAAPRAPKTAGCMLSALLLTGLVATVTVYVTHPGFFSGHH